MDGIEKRARFLLCFASSAVVAHFLASSSFVCCTRRLYLVVNWAADIISKLNVITRWFLAIYCMWCQCRVGKLRKCPLVLTMFFTLLDKHCLKGKTIWLNNAPKQWGWTAIEEAQQTRQNKPPSLQFPSPVRAYKFVPRNSPHIVQWASAKI